MSEIGVVPKILSALHSLPLWIFVSLAVAGFAALLVPSFGGADVIGFHAKWGWLCWLDAVVFSVFSLCCAVDLAVKAVRARRKKWYQHQKALYSQVYVPLYKQLMEIHIITSNAMLAPFLRVRLKNAGWELRNNRRKGAALWAAWKAIFDRKITKEKGEVDYGGTFPIGMIEYIVRSNISFCDEQLAVLMHRAVNYRKEERVGTDDLSEDDVALYNYIVKRRDQLKRIVYPGQT